MGLLKRLHGASMAFQVVSGGSHGSPGPPRGLRVFRRFEDISGGSRRSLRWLRKSQGHS